MHTSKSNQPCSIWRRNHSIPMTRLWVKVLGMNISSDDGLLHLHANLLPNECRLSIIPLGWGEISFWTYNVFYECEVEDSNFKMSVILSKDQWIVCQSRCADRAHVWMSPSMPYFSQKYCVLLLVWRYRIHKYPMGILERIAWITPLWALVYTCIFSYKNDSDIMHTF